jgi:diadenosine tetraphosphate (Ap4A) HIT family hydrolase
MNFQVDPKIHINSIFLGKTDLCAVYLKNNKNFPWLVLVPMKNNLSQLCQLSAEDWILLGNDIRKFSNWVNVYFKPEQLNIANLGNIVKQLHVHIVGRNSQDLAWPHSVWQADLPELPYSAAELDAIKQSSTACF